jgi:dipeptidyl aminopeptidase/acylaminoacyl peptidase
LPDGTIVEQVPKVFSDLPDYGPRLAIAKKRIAEDAMLKTDADRAGALADWQRAIPEKDYTEFRTQTAVTISKIKYMSDGLKVSGYIFRPTALDGKKYPVAIFNHGGNRNPLVLLELINCYRYLAKKGFVVIAPEYRGNGDSEGKDEFGGADVNDVMNLIPLAGWLPYADTNNVFMYGVSRGSMMTFEAIRNKVAINAAVIDSGVPDVEANGRWRPDMVEHVFKELIPDFDKRASEQYKLRSASLFADQLNTPMLLLHGTADRRADPLDTLKFAAKLQELGKPYELVMYDRDAHGLPKNQEDAWARIVDWFRKHMR